MTSSDWRNKKVAFLGDSITDRIHVGTEKNYWQYLHEELGIDPLVYGINGAQWYHILSQVDALFKDHGTDLDAIFIFMGTNDYISDVLPGEWFSYRTEKVNVCGVNRIRMHRLPVMDQETFCGRINLGMSRIKEIYPLQQIVLMTPIHRAFAAFGDTNVQPDESYANGLGLFLEDYVELIRKAADIWSCPLIDLYRCSGLYPLTPSHGRFFHIDQTDRLHPNMAGHERIARTMIAQMAHLSATFR